MKSNGDKTAGSIEELRQFMKKFDTAMLVTSTPAHKLRGRPMAMQNPDDVPGCDLWFVTGDDSPKIQEIAVDEEVAVCCYKADRSYLSISATARRHRDKELIAKLFNPTWKAWFEGPDDPRIVLLKLNVERAEYWEPEGGRLRVLYEMAKAAITGEEAKLNPPKTI